jgi:hypothetical protein
LVLPLPPPRCMVKGPPLIRSISGKPESPIMLDAKSTLHRALRMKFIPDVHFHRDLCFFVCSACISFTGEFFYRILVVVGRRTGHKATLPLLPCRHLTLFFTPATNCSIRRCHVRFFLSFSLPISPPSTVPFERCLTWREYIEHSHDVHPSHTSTPSSLH